MTALDTEVELSRATNRAAEASPLHFGEGFETEPRQKEKKHVNFTSIQIREYDRIVGDNPEVDLGPPLSFAWEFEQREPVDVDEYEERRGERRPEWDLKLSLLDRRKILMAVGYSDQDIVEARKEIEEAYANADKATEPPSAAPQEPQINEKAKKRSSLTLAKKKMKRTLYRGFQGLALAANPVSMGART